MRCHRWEGNCVMTGDIQSVAGVRMRKESPNGECHGIPARPQYVLRDVIKGMYSTVRITEWNIDLTGEIPRCRDAAFHFPPLLTEKRIQKFIADIVRQLVVEKCLYRRDGIEIFRIQPLTFFGVEDITFCNALKTTLHRSHKRRIADGGENEMDFMHIEEHGLPREHSVA